VESIWSAFLGSGAICPELKHIQRRIKKMDEQELNKRERLARLDAYYSALKGMIPPVLRNESEEEKDEKD
jgi:hypothetical protein